MLKTSVAKASDAPQPGRRAFLGGAGLVAALGTLGASQFVATAAQAQSVSDADVLNFALNLEYLEAEFYLRAAYGRGLDQTDTDGRGTPGDVSGGRRVPFKTKIIREYAEEIAQDELAHVKFLRSALGRSKVARPQIDLGASFTTAAKAAGLIKGRQKFDAYANEANFLLAAFVFEDVGVTAYKGAARFISNKDYLEAAAGILAVEAYHAGEIRSLIVSRGLGAAAGKIAALRDAATGAEKSVDQGPVVNGKANVVPTDANGIAFSRTPQQVLNVVYLGGADADFGFFPNKLNGELK